MGTASLRVRISTGICLRWLLRLFLSVTLLPQRQKGPSDPQDNSYQLQGGKLPWGTATRPHQESCPLGCFEPHAGKPPDTREPSRDVVVLLRTDSGATCQQRYRDTKRIVSILGEGERKRQMNTGVLMRFGVSDFFQSFLGSLMLPLLSAEHRFQLVWKSIVVSAAVCVAVRCAGRFGCSASWVCVYGQLETTHFRTNVLST